MIDAPTNFPPVRHAWFDSSRAPIYVWTFPMRITDAELDEALEAHRRWRQHAEFECAFVVDLSPMREATARQRWVVARHFADATEHTRRYVVATAVVVPTALQRAMLRAVCWIHPPPTPLHLAESVADGIRMCESVLASRGVERDLRSPGMP